MSLVTIAIPVYKAKFIQDSIKSALSQTYRNIEILIVDDFHIRIGSGMRMKIMDAIPSYSPIVTTTKGCEGIPLQNERDCFIKDSPEDFTDAIIKLSKDFSIQESIVKSAFENTKGMLDTESLLKRRLEFYKQC